MTFTAVSMFQSGEGEVLKCARCHGNSVRREGVPLIWCTMLTMCWANSSEGLRQTWAPWTCWKMERNSSSLLPGSPGSREPRRSFAGSPAELREKEEEMSWWFHTTGGTDGTQSRSLRHYLPGLTLKSNSSPLFPELLVGGVTSFLLMLLSLANWSAGRPRPSSASSSLSAALRPRPSAGERDSGSSHWPYRSRADREALPLRLAPWGLPPGPGSLSSPAAKEGPFWKEAPLMGKRLLVVLFPPLSSPETFSSWSSWDACCFSFCSTRNLRHGEGKTIPSDTPSRGTPRQSTPL